MFDGKQIKDASITKSKLNLTTPSSNNDPATKQYVDDTTTQAIYNQDWKASVRVAVGTNVNTSSPGATLDGISMNVGDRVLLYGQTTGSQNWIWVWNGAAVAMTRALDADGNSEVTPQAAVSVEEGTNASKSFRITNTGAITVGTTAIIASAFATFTSSSPVTSNKNMTASATTSDNDVACSTGMAGTPYSGSFVSVFVNGVFITVGDGDKTHEAYFSGDSGSTARAFNAIVSGDKLYWVGSVAGYQLSTSDRINFNYNV